MLRNPTPEMGTPAHGPTHIPTHVRTVNKHTYRQHTFIYIQAVRHTDTQTCGHTNIQPCRQALRQTFIQTSRQTDNRQTDRQTDTPTRGRMRNYVWRQTQKRGTRRLRPAQVDIYPSPHRLTHRHAGRHAQSEHAHTGTQLYTRAHANTPAQRQTHTCTHAHTNTRGQADSQRDRYNQIDGQTSGQGTNTTGKIGPSPIMHKDAVKMAATNIYK